MSKDKKKQIEKARRIFRKRVKGQEPDEQYLSDVVDACEAEGTPLSQRIKEDAEEFLND